MRHQVFATYYQLSLQDRVEILSCNSHDEATSLIPGIDDDGNTFLWCSQCTNRIIPGLDLYYKLLERINHADPYPDFPAEAN